MAEHFVWFLAVLSVTFLDWTSSNPAGLQNITLASPTNSNVLNRQERDIVRHLCNTKGGRIPQTISEEELTVLAESNWVSFRAYSRAYRMDNYTDARLQLPHDYTPDKNVFVITHGYLGYCDDYKQMIKALLKEKDCLVVCTQWEHKRGVFEFIFGNSYKHAAGLVRFVSEEITKLLINLQDSNKINLQNLHLIGFSLGAHVMGFVGKRVQCRLNGLTLTRITGLDPAGPIFDYIPDDDRLNNTDATFVDIIHTDLSDLGTGCNAGDANFFPNGGESQPGCWLSPCRHFVAKDYFVSSISNCCPFTAIECLDVNCKLAHRLGNYDPEMVPNNSTNRMGFHAHKPAKQTSYYLTTTDTWPYCPEPSSARPNHSIATFLRILVGLVLLLLLRFVMWLCVEIKIKSDDGVTQVHIYRKRQVRSYGGLATIT